MAKLGDRWSRLRPELLRRQSSGEPVKTLVQGIPNTILEVGEDYVIVMSTRPLHGKRKPRKILAQEINGGDISWLTGRRRITLALRELADRLT